MRILETVLHIHNLQHRRFLTHLADFLSISEQDYYWVILPKCIGKKLIKRTNVRTSFQNYIRSSNVLLKINI